ncbi:CA14 [Symbiodinium pilosum]|uniref:CA14 protein n=1 Tax=Symbiodinium pilosum TaxID=2952 RepID=A0A812NB67_SYMPI|nr:CA14 [Symbiodinium pilosum]
MVVAAFSTAAVTVGAENQTEKNMERQSSALLAFACLRDKISGPQSPTPSQSGARVDILQLLQTRTDLAIRSDQKLSLLAGPANMFLDGMMSQIGISTQGSLDALRRQLGPGVDPLYDYSAKHDSHRPRHVEKKEQEGTKESTGIEQLRRTLKEVVGINTTAEELEPQQAEEGDDAEFRVPAARLRALREQKRPMSSFVSTSREYVNALAIENRFRAPPPGSYRPSTHLCAPRVKTPVFTNGEPTQSRKRMVMEREVRKLQSQGKPYEHLLQGVTSVELLDEPPEKMRRAITTPNLERYSPRPDLLKSAGINFNDSTFTDGVLDGDCNTSMILRTPEWDFAKLSAARDKDPETYFQPGQYKPNLDAVRPKLETKNIPFQKLPARKPLKEAVGRFEVDGREGDHLPDRSLARSCPLLATRPRLHSPDLAKYSERPPGDTAPHVHCTPAMVVRWYMLCLAAGAGCLLPVPFFLSVDTTLEAVSQLEMSKPLAAVGDFTESGVEFITGRCPKRNAVGEVTLYMGDDVNDSANRAVWNENQWATRHVISKSIEDAFDVKHVYGHILHDLLPMVIWVSAAHPKARIVLELDIKRKIKPFLNWFDPELSKKTLFVNPEEVVCGSALWAVVPKVESPHGLRIPPLLNNLRRHIARVLPTYEAKYVVCLTWLGDPTVNNHPVLTNRYAVRMKATAGNGRLLTDAHNKEEQHRIFSSAILSFGPHGTAFANLIWMPCTVPAAAIEFICSAHSTKVRGCDLPDGKVRMATTWSLEGSLSWLKYFHVMVEDAFKNISDYMRVDLDGFDQALEAALWHIRPRKQG